MASYNLCWYSRGEINDQSLIGLGLQEVIQVDAGRLNQYIIQIISTNRDFLDPNTDFGEQLNAKKFDVSAIAQFVLKNMIQYEVITESSC